MLLYNLRLAWLSLRRSPLLSVLMVGAIALGIAGASTFVTTYYLIASDPIPEKSDRLFYVRLDSWDPERSFSRSRPHIPPVQITYRDAVALMESDIPIRHTAMFEASMVIEPDSEALRPFEVETRLCYRGFFPLFQVPFQYGGPWSQEADNLPQTVAVLDSETNARLFGGADSVGRTIAIQDRLFEVVGVLAPWKPLVKFYDTHQSALLSRPESLYIPFQLVREMEIPSAGNVWSWSDSPRTFAELLESESVWIQMWVELDGPEHLARYRDFLDAYALEQRALGRFQRPLNNWVQPILEWLEEDEVVPPSARSLAIIAVLFLVVCAVNLVGILLGKFLSRSAVVGVRRALGASRGAIFIQHLVECELVALLGGLGGIALSVGGLEAVERLFRTRGELELDATMLVAGLAMAAVAGLIAGAYPAWRICRLPPATYLKVQ